MSLHQHGVMIKLIQSGSCEGLQWLDARSLDSLVINITKYYENNQSILYRIRSSSQRRLRRVSELLCSEYRNQTNRRRLQSPRPYLDKLSNSSSTTSWASCLPYSNQGQRQQGTLPTASCLRHSTSRTPKGTLYPLFAYKIGSFLASNLKKNFNAYLRFFPTCTVAFIQPT